MSHKVLIADDEPNIVVSLEFMMKREGYEVLVARDGLQALEAIRRERPRLVLLDAMMPGMTGFDVCEAVRADEAVRDTLILMLTAKGRESDVARGTGAGADAYVTKPFSTRDLMQKVRDMLAVKLDRRLMLAMLAPGAALAVWLALGGVLLRMTLDPAQRAAVDSVLGPLIRSHGMLTVLWWLIAAALAAWAAHRHHAAHVAAPAQLADATRVLVGDAAAPDLVPQGSDALRGLTAAINGLARQRRGLQEDMARLVAEASRDVEQQRDQLAALMAELNQSVLVCNLDGRILLYNERARQLYRQLFDRPPGASGAELVGLGRSIYGLIDRALIAHALETVEGRIARVNDAAAAPAGFVTGTPAGHLLRVSLAPVRAASGGAERTGFVLLLDDITDEYETQSRRDRQLLELTEASRASFASIQAALEMLDYPDLEAEERERFHKVVRDEVSAMSARLATLAASTSQDLMTRWPLQEMLGADLLAAVARRIEVGVRSYRGLWTRSTGPCG